MHFAREGAGSFGSPVLLFAAARGGTPGGALRAAARSRPRPRSAAGDTASSEGAAWPGGKARVGEGREAFRRGRVGVPA
jgi:hypothetical protein